MKTTFNINTYQILVTCLLLFIVSISSITFAAQLKQQKKVVLQLTDNTTQKQILILNVSDNLLKQYGENIKLEIVAFGPGLQLLFNENKYSQRVSKLAKQGVKFSACRNTYKKMEKTLGKNLQLHEYANETEGGAARILELIEQGYILLRP